MDSGNQQEPTYATLEFLRSKSLSKQAKIMEFWKYLDNQDILKPYKPPKRKSRHLIIL